MGLQVGIIGAGVAGLSATIALSRIGHEVEVGGFEGTWRRS
jgi:phytoene dehydrogenase-like protein